MARKFIILVPSWYLNIFKFILGPQEAEIKRDRYVLNVSQSDHYEFTDNHNIYFLHLLCHLLFSSMPMGQLFVYLFALLNLHYFCLDYLNGVLVKLTWQDIKVYILKTGKLTWSVDLLRINKIIELDWINLRIVD